MGKILSPCTNGPCGNCDRGGDTPNEHVNFITPTGGQKESKSTVNVSNNSDITSNRDAITNEAVQFQIKNLEKFDYGEAVDDERYRDLELEQREEVQLDGGIRYEGQWIQGTMIRHGKGKQMLADGSMYEGWWQMNMANGKGRFLDSKGLFYEGNWRDNKKNGDGTFQWPDGRIYKGNFEDNMFSGQGKIVWPNGQTYIGSWKANQMEGQGIYTWPDGRKYDGFFKYGKQHGKATYTTREGKVKTGLWSHGKRQTSTENSTFQSPVNTNENANLTSLQKDMQNGGQVKVV